MLTVYKAGALAVLSSLMSAGAAQSTLDPSNCVPGSGITTFANCNSAETSVSACATATEKAEFLSCWCEQKLLTNVFECENEERLCLGSNDFDSGLDQFVSLWHQSCDNYITFTPTTPAKATITASYDSEACTSIYSDCVQVSTSRRSCRESYTAAADQSSCVCAPALQTINFNCKYGGNETCLGVSAATTNLYGYGFCSNFDSVIGPLVGATTTTENTLSSISHTTTHSASVAPTITSAPTPSVTGSITVSRPSATSTVTTSTRTSAAESLISRLVLSHNVCIGWVVVLTGMVLFA